MAKGKRCAHCGEKIEGKGTYCGSICKQAAYRQRHSQAGSWRTAPARAVETKKAQVISLTCAHCGETFEISGLQANSVYCSDACKMRAYRQRKKNAPIA